MTFSDWHPTYSMTEITRIMFSGTTVLSTWWRLERKFSVRCGQATGGSDSKTPSLLGRKYWHSFCTWTRLTSRIMGAQCIQYICRSAIYTYPSGIIADENWNCTNFFRQKLSGKRLVGFLPSISVLTKYKGTPRVAIYKRQVLRKALAHVTAQITNAVNSPERGIRVTVGDQGKMRHLLCTPQFTNSRQLRLCIPGSHSSSLTRRIWLDASLGCSTARIVSGLVICASLASKMNH